MDDFYNEGSMGKFFVFCRTKLKFCSWLYKKHWHTSWKFQLEITSNKKLLPKSLWQTYMKWTVTQILYQWLSARLWWLLVSLLLLTVALLWVINHDPVYEMSSAKSEVWYNIQNAPKSFKISQNVVRVSNSLDLDETPSSSASHPDPSCLRMGLWPRLAG